jgi:DNA-directed RNA polymerase subunit M/transcription elongation factor TFIIS
MIIFTCPVCKGVLAAEQSDIDTMVACQHCQASIQLSAELAARNAVDIASGTSDDKIGVSSRTSRTAFFVIIGVLLLLGMRLCQNHATEPPVTPPGPSIPDPKPVTTPEPLPTPVPPVDPLAPHRETIRAITSTYVVLLQNTIDLDVAQSTLGRVEYLLSQSFSKPYYKCGVVPHDTIAPSSYYVCIYGFQDYSDAENAVPQLYDALRDELNLTTPTQLQVEMLYR